MRTIIGSIAVIDILFCVCDEGNVLTFIRFFSKTNNPTQCIICPITSQRAISEDIFTFSFGSIWKHQSNLMGLELVVRRNLLDRTRTWMFINSDYKAVKTTDRRHQKHYWFQSNWSLLIFWVTVTPHGVMERRIIGSGDSLSPARNPTMT